MIVLCYHCKFYCDLLKLIPVPLMIFENATSSSPLFHFVKKMDKIRRYEYKVLCLKKKKKKKRTLKVFKD